MTQKAKNWMSVLAVAIIAYLILAYYLNLWPAGSIRDQGSEISNSDEVCAQVIAFAVNPETGKIQEFPTPCDVPDGWAAVEADIISE